MNTYHHVLNTLVFFSDQIELFLIFVVESDCKAFGKWRTSHGEHAKCRMPGKLYTISWRSLSRVLASRIVLTLGNRADNVCVNYQSFMVQPKFFEYIGRSGGFYQLFEDRLVDNFDIFIFDFLWKSLPQVRGNMISWYLTSFCYQKR